MLIQILHHTPTWVLGLFLVLLVLGLRQLVARRVSLRRVTLLPLALALWSLYAVGSSFAALALAPLAWLGAAAALAVLVASRPAPSGTHYDAWQDHLVLPGSALPLLLMLGLFGSKYAVGVALALQPELAAQAPFALPVAALYGGLSGLLLGRSARLWRLVLRAQPKVWA